MYQLLREQHFLHIPQMHYVQFLVKLKMMYFLGQFPSFFLEGKILVLRVSIYKGVKEAGQGRGSI